MEVSVPLGGCLLDPSKHSVVSFKEQNILISSLVVYKEKLAVISKGDGSNKSKATDKKNRGGKIKVKLNKNNTIYDRAPRFKLSSNIRVPILDSVHNMELISSQIKEEGLLEVEFAVEECMKAKGNFQ
ncbi:hypothetical protein PVK06_047376 [Gossypium arboreum]|uniref:Uncharacterized protein n=1 Tax=Gossypium arboreum TaxID=29729 RepID=A0ABR0MD30_GOSAR|nr:hypothetical protein PVK06_047376 [Gossypium arboreum]